MVEEILGEQDQKRITSKIVDIINKELRTCFWPKSRKLIMERGFFKHHIGY
jgi:hypothetical protein